MMDIGCIVIFYQYLRFCFDVGIFGMMGIGLGLVFVVVVVELDCFVVVVFGDLVFGFFGMECEVVCCYGLLIKIVVINNNGIGGGVVEFDFEKKLLMLVYIFGVCYEKVMEVFGGEGFFVEFYEELGFVFDCVFVFEVFVLVNVMIDLKVVCKFQKFEWLMW